MFNAGPVKTLYRVFVYDSDGRYREITPPPHTKGFPFSEVFSVVDTQLASAEFSDGAHCRLVVTDTNDNCHLDYIVGRGVVYPTQESALVQQNLSHICSTE